MTLPRVAIADLTEVIEQAYTLARVLRPPVTDPALAHEAATLLRIELERLRDGPVELEDPHPLRYRLDELLGNPQLMQPPPEVIPRLAWESHHTLFASREKRGKSTLLGYAASQASQGRNFLGRPCTPQTVLIVGLEEFVGHLARRLRDFGANPERVHIVDALASRAEGRLAEIRTHAIETGATLIIVDTLMAFISGGVTDTSAAAQMEPFVQGLTRIARDTKAAIITAGHSKKSDGGYRDSSAIGGAVDCIAEMRDEETADKTLRTVTMRGRVPVYDFSFRYADGDFTLVTAEDLSPAEDPSTLLGKVTAAQADLARAIVDTVAKNPGLSGKGVRERSEARAADTDRTLARLLDAGLIVDCGTASAHRYFVPEAAPKRMLDEGRPAEHVGTTLGRPSGTTLSADGTTSDDLRTRGGRSLKSQSRVSVPNAVPPLKGGRRDDPLNTARIGSQNGNGTHPQIIGDEEAI